MERPCNFEIAREGARHFISTPDVPIGDVLKLRYAAKCGDIEGMKDLIHGKLIPIDTPVGEVGFANGILRHFFCLIHI